MRRLNVLVVAAISLTALPVSAGAPAVAVERISFTVTNPLTPRDSWQVRGAIYRPAAAAACDRSVMLLLHGLSYGAWGWDFPIEPERYSVARALAAAGYPAVAVDRLGYGTSDRMDGRTLTVESYAAITAQMIAQLRAGTYTAPTQVAFGKVGLLGHSAGAEIAELTAGTFGGVDALIAGAYTHFPSQRIAVDFASGDIPRALQDDYEYFGGTPAQRSEYMYDLSYADPAIVQRDTAMANLTPSGEILTISMQPSRFVVPAVRTPVLLVLAENDLLFPAENGDEELALFASAQDKSVYVAPRAGHSFMLHPNAPETNAAIVEWLRDRPQAIPGC